MREALTTVNGYESLLDNLLTVAWPSGKTIDILYIFNVVMLKDYEMK